MIDLEKQTVVEKYESSRLSNRRSTLYKCDPFPFLIRIIAPHYYLKTITAFPIQIDSVILSEEPMAQVNILSLPIETVQGIVNVCFTRGQGLSDQFSSLLLSIAATTGAAGPKDASTGLFMVRPCL
jgi:hypothetical protein